MPSPFDGLSSIFVDTFGQAVTIHAELSDIEVMGIFNPRSVDALGVSQPEAMLHLRTEDATHITNGIHVEISGQFYTCRVSDPDGKGMVPIRLEKTDGFY